MQELAEFFNLPGGVIVEVGSRDGHDAKAMRDIFVASRVVTVEANPECFDKICASYPDFDSYNLAIGNRTGKAEFWRVDQKYGDIMVGQSSTLYKPSYDTIASKIEVDMMTMDDFVSSIGLNEIEALKIDVEGATFELLQGFSKIRMARLLHIESEHFEFWEGQKMYDDTASFMHEAGYEQVYFAPVWTNQSDSIWLRRD